MAFLWNIDCPNSLACVVDFHIGDLVQNFSYPGISGDVLVFRLGSGSNGEVYRIIFPDGQILVVKKYLSEHSAYQDRVGLKGVKKIFSDARLSLPLGVRVARTRAGKDQASSEIENVYGWALHDFLMRDFPSINIKRILVDRYNTFLKSFDLISRKIPEWLLVREELGYYFNLNKFELRAMTVRHRYANQPLFLKPSQFIVESGTYQLVLIDHY